MSLFWWIHPLRTLKVWRQVRAHNKQYTTKISLREVLRFADDAHKRWGNMQ